MRLSALAGLPVRTVAGTFWRAAQLRHLSTPLSTRHTRHSPGRFNAGTPDRPGPEVLYLAADLLTAQIEVGILLGSPDAGRPLLPNPHAVGWSMLPVSVRMRRVVDLTEPAVLAALRTSVQELTGDWTGYAERPAVPPLRRPYWSNVPTQRLATPCTRPGQRGSSPSPPGCRPGTTWSSSPPTCRPATA